MTTYFTNAIPSDSACASSCESVDSWRDGPGAQLQAGCSLPSNAVEVQQVSQWRATGRVIYLIGRAVLQGAESPQTGLHGGAAPVAASQKRPASTGPKLSHARSTVTACPVIAAPFVLRREAQAPAQFSLFIIPSLCSTIIYHRT